MWVISDICVKACFVHVILLIHYIFYIYYIIFFILCCYIIFILYYIILYYIILYYIILYYIILYYIILYSFNARIWNVFRFTSSLETVHRCCSLCVADTHRTEPKSILCCFQRRVTPLHKWHPQPSVHLHMIELLMIT